MATRVPSPACRPDWIEATSPFLEAIATRFDLRLQIIGQDLCAVYDSGASDQGEPTGEPLAEWYLELPEADPLELRLWASEAPDSRLPPAHAQRLLSSLGPVLEAHAVARQQHAHRRRQLATRRKEADLLCYFSPVRIQQDARELHLAPLADQAAAMLDEGYVIVSLLDREYSFIRGRIGESDAETLITDPLPWSALSSVVLELCGDARTTWIQLPEGLRTEIESRSGKEVDGICVPIEVDGRALGYLSLIRPRGCLSLAMPSARLLRGLAHRIAGALGAIQIRSELHCFLFNTVKSLIAAVEAKDTYTRGHSERVHYLAMRTGLHLGLSPGDMETLNWAALLHDIGKRSIPGAVLTKSEPLTTDEWDLIRTHPERGCDLVATIPRLAGALPAIRHHHENYAGGGYPSGLKGEGIPRLARVIAVADAFDALTSDRAYNDQLSCSEALVIMEKSAGVKFDPLVVAAVKRGVSGEMATGSLAFESLRRRSGHRDPRVA